MQDGVGSQISGANILIKHPLSSPGSFDSGCALGGNCGTAILLILPFSLEVDQKHQKRSLSSAHFLNCQQGPQLVPSLGFESC